LIASFVPVRLFIVSRLFTDEDLRHLDPVDESDDDYLDEQAEYNKSDAGSTEFRGISEFRTKGVDHNSTEYYKHHPDTLRNRSKSLGSQNEEVEISVA
jgi:hypothetical protein